MICRLCGLEAGSGSLGGRDICAPCDCGTPPEVSRVKVKLREANERIAALEQSDKRQFESRIDAELRADHAEAALHEAQAQIATLADAAGERESIAALLADREEMTTYLKVEALVDHCAELEARCLTLTQERDDLRADIYRMVQQNRPPETAAGQRAIKG